MMRKKRKNHGDGPPMVDPKKGGGVPKSTTKMSKTSTLFHFQQSSQWLVTISYVTFSLTVLNTFWRNTIEKYKCFSKATRMVMVIFSENANVKIIMSFLAPKKRVQDFFCFLRAILKINQLQKTLANRFIFCFFLDFKDEDFVDGLWLKIIQLNNCS